MILQRLNALNFKNIEEASLELSPKINCFLGDNGMGKSNLLDALYFLSFCKSFTGVNDNLLIRKGQDFAMLKGIYQRRGIDEELYAGLRQGRRKSFKRAGKEYKRIAEHIGLFPLVILSPADMSLISGEPSERRRFIDQIASQSDSKYLDALIRYNSAMEQRNKLLKDECIDDSLFEILEMQMDNSGLYIIQRRQETIDRLSALFQKYYPLIAGDREKATISYQRSITEGRLADILATKRERDKILHYTGSGPHRDDIDMTLDGLPVRRCASQGQTKTFTSALRFAQYELLKESLGIRPLLLLDDIFDKLDAKRVASIMELVGGEKGFGQIFITDTNRRHLDEIVANIPHSPHSLWNVKDGIFTQIATHP